MKATDKKIVEANPGLTPYELLTTKGLSEAGFQELLAAEDKNTADLLNAKPAPTPTEKKLKPAGILKPALSASVSALPHLQHSRRTDKVRIVPTSGGGAGTEMSRVHAEALLRKNPNKYRIHG